MKKMLVLLLVVGCIVIHFLFRGSRDHKLIQRGKNIILRIESFKSIEKHLPNSLKEIEVEDEEIFYNKYDSIHYLLWYGTALGESVIYYSDTKKWETGARGFKSN